MKIEKALNRIVELLEERLPEPLSIGDLFSEWAKEDEDVYLSDLLKNMPLDHEDEVEEEGFELEIEIDMDDIFTNKMLGIWPLPSFTLETGTPKKIDNRAAEIEIDTSELQDWLEGMKYIISKEHDDFNPYDEEYFYVVLSDPRQTDGVFRVLARNENDEVVIDGLYFDYESELWDEIEGNPDYMFTEREIKENHAYLWSMRCSVDYDY